jgi:hypothetical protein
MPIHVVEEESTNIASIYQRVRAQKVSPTEIVTNCLKRIEQLNPKLNAFITILAEQALEQARVVKQRSRQENGVVPCMAFRWGSKISTIPPGSERPRLLNISRTVYLRRMQLASLNSRGPARS